MDKKEFRYMIVEYNKLIPRKRDRIAGYFSDEQDAIEFCEYMATIGKSYGIIDAITDAFLYGEELPNYL